MGFFDAIGSGLKKGLEICGEKLEENCIPVMRASSKKIKKFNGFCVLDASPYEGIVKTSKGFYLLHDNGLFFSKNLVFFHRINETIFDSYDSSSQLFCYGNYLFYMNANTAQYSLDGNTWEYIDLPDLDTNFTYKHIFSNGTKHYFYASSEDEHIIYSGNDFSKLTPYEFSNDELKDIKFCDAGIFICMESNNQCSITTSKDGIFWNEFDVPNEFGFQESFFYRIDKRCFCCNNKYIYNTKNDTWCEVSIDGHFTKITNPFSPFEKAGINIKSLEFSNPIVAFPKYHILAKPDSGSFLLEKNLIISLYLLLMLTEIQLVRAVDNPYIQEHS